MLGRSPRGTSRSTARTPAGLIPTMKLDGGHRRIVVAGHRCLHGLLQWRDGAGRAAPTNGSGRRGHAGSRFPTCCQAVRDRGRPGDRAHRGIGSACLHSCDNRHGPSRVRASTTRGRKPVRRGRIVVITMLDEQSIAVAGCLGLNLAVIGVGDRTRGRSTQPTLWRPRRHVDRPGSIHRTRSASHRHVRLYHRREREPRHSRQRSRNIRSMSSAAPFSCHDVRVIPAAGSATPCRAPNESPHSEHSGSRAIRSSHAGTPPTSIPVVRSSRSTWSTNTSACRGKHS